VIIAADGADQIISIKVIEIESNYFEANAKTINYYLFSGVIRTGT
jgi:hypothetical protein